MAALHPFLGTPRHGLSRWGTPPPGWPNQDTLGLRKGDTPSHRQQDTGETETPRGQLKAIASQAGMRTPDSNLEIPSPQPCPI